VIEGNGGADYLSGDLPISSPYFPDTISGGEGDDVIDARDRPLEPTSTVDCGPGADRVAAQEDDRLTGCESSVFGRYPQGSLADSSFSLDNSVLTLLTPIAPVSRGPDGAPTYDIPCPGGAGAQACTGNVTLERPPAASGGTPESLGSGAFTIPPGERRNVTVTLNPAGVAALATPGALLSVHVTGTIPSAPPAPGTPPATPMAIDYGWQTAF
jgi:hypothetical protein